MSVTPVITFSHVTFGYQPRQPVLESISLSIKKGEFVALVGPNGGGKTTLLKLITGLEKPQKGTVTVSEAQIGYVPQRIGQDTSYVPVTVEEVVGMGRIARRGLFRQFGAEDRAQIELALKKTGMTAKRHREIHQLSGGERQRVYIARALASEPSILILDEPTVGIDASSQEAFLQFLKELHQSLQLTILFVTHDLDVVTRTADHIICVNKHLICHTDQAHFSTKDYLLQVYGPDVQPVSHHHTDV